MEKIVLKDMYSLVEEVKNHRELFPAHVDCKKARCDLEAYYDGVLANRTFMGGMQLIKSFGAKIPAVRKKAARKVAANVMDIYPQSRCDAYIRDSVEDILVNGDRYIEAYELLDADSKAVYLDLLLFRLTGDFTYVLKHVCPSRQYFSEKIKWKEHPNIIDCGAYTGDTFLAFYDMGITPNHYFLYELEDENYKSLIDNINGKNCNVHPAKKGVYSEKATFYYESLGDSSRLVPYETEQKVEVVALDDDVDVKPDFIKMDIEGGEAPALRGGANLIKKYHPTLAVCIYHLKDDFWKIPLLIHEICPAYKHYWIEHYSLGYNETVLFVDM